MRLLHRRHNARQGGARNSHFQPHLRRFVELTYAPRIRLCTRKGTIAPGTRDTKATLLVVADAPGAGLRHRSAHGADKGARHKHRHFG